MPSSSISPSPYPGLPRSGFLPWRERKKWWSSLPSSSAAPLGSITIQLRYCRATDRLGGIYRKMHIPDDPLYYEKFYFTPGDLGFKSFDTSVGQVGALICWDQWYPEAARITALRGANLLFYPTAIGWHPAEKERFGSAQYEAWQTIQRSHAIANGVYVASVNRVGHEHGDVRGNRAPGVGLEFWGGSFIADPFGRVLAQAPHHEEAILIEEVDLKNLEDTRRNWPFLRDRRIDFYPPITARFLDDGK